jgi:hypothetical protein
MGTVFPVCPILPILCKSARIHTGIRAAGRSRGRLPQDVRLYRSTRTLPKREITMVRVLDPRVSSRDAFESPRV